MKNLARYDQGEIKTYADFTDEGFLKCDAIVTRTGVFFYKNPDGTIRRELRHPNDVLNEDSLQTMKMIPLTNNHPPERLVNAENAKRLSVGYTGENVRAEGSFIYSNFVVTDNQAINEVVQTGKKQLSLGYTVDLIEEKGNFDGEEYDFRQTNIKYNHLSIVTSARAGSEARIALDESDAFEISQTNYEEAVVAKRKIKIDEDEFMMEPEMADSVEKLVEDMKNLSEEKTRVEDELKMIKDKLEKALAERDNAKEEAMKLLEEKKGSEESQKMDSKEVEKRVRERLSLLKTAEKTLSSEELDRVDSLSDLEIKKMVIKAKSKNANLDGKSEVYINARYDAVLEDLPKTQVIVSGSKSKTHSDSNEISAEKSRSKMIENLKNGYKLGGK